MDEILFQITKEHLDTGLRGFPVGYCPTSYVHAQKGLFYCDQLIEELAYLKPEQVIYLLYHGKEGNLKEIETFFKDLQKRMRLSSQSIAAIEKLPQSGHPMKLLSIALLLVGIFEGTGLYREDCLNLIAKLPHLVACMINHHAGWGETPLPKEQLGYMENFSHMLLVPHKKEEELTKAFNLFNILHYDHGGGNLSTFVGKAVASSLEDLYGSISSAMCALAGPKHGKANQDCLEFVRGILEELGESATERQVDELIRDRLAKNQLVFGFGHAVLRVEDPRATILYEYVKKHYNEHPLAKIALILRKVGQKILSENPKISDPHPNVDAISGTMLAASGFDYPEYFTVLFGLSRSVGIAIQIVYERLEARDGKGTPIVRPKYFYKARF